MDALFVSVCVVAFVFGARHMLKHEDIENKKTEDLDIKIRALHKRKIKKNKR